MVANELLLFIHSSVTELKYLGSNTMKCLTCKGIQYMSLASTLIKWLLLLSCKYFDGVIPLGIDVICPLIVFTAVMLTVTNNVLAIFILWSASRWCRPNGIAIDYTVYILSLLTALTFWITWGALGWQYIVQLESSLVIYPPHLWSCLLMICHLVSRKTDN